MLDEKFTAPRKVAPGFQPPNAIPVGFGESHFYESDDSFDLPEMHTFSSGKMELTDVIPIPTEEAQFKVPDNLIKDTLYITEYPKIRFSLDAVSREIMGNLTCMREVRPVYARERIKCFQQLVSIISHLQEGDLSKVADKYIQFPTRDSNATEDMHAIIDAFGAAALNETQKILTERILLKNPPDAGLLKKLFLHFVNLPNPPPSIFIDALEDLVFEGAEFSDDEDTKEITTMATLLLGSLAGSLKSTNLGRAERLVARMETELQLHDPQKHRTVRSAETETYENHHEQRKATLLLSLGNAGLDRSYHHILSYVNTTDSPQLLRRRGAAAIANYHHEDAASMLLSIALDNNHEDHVRYDALLEYRRHPKAVPISDIQYHLVRGLTNITGLNKRHHSRLKRGIFDGIKFQLKLPGYEWNKQVGSEKIGASFGLTIRNIMDLEIAPLKGHFKIDVLDEAYAVANIGVLGIHQDLARIRFCFRGYIKYEINILQEFNFEDIFNIVKLLDSVVNNIVGSIKQTIESFRQLFDSTSDLSFPKIIQRFADAFDEIPFKIDDLRAIGQKAIQTIGEIVDPPDFITDVSNVIRRVTALVTDIKTDVTKFYDSIADAITVTLPWAIDQIKEAVNMVVNTLKNFFKSPLSALGDIQKAILKIQLAISSVLDAKKRIEDACLFTKGQRPYWFDIKSVITEIWEDVLTAKDSVLKAFEWFNGKHSGDEIFKEFTGVDASVIRQQIKEELLASLDIFISGPLQVIQELAAPFVSTYESVVKTINAVKTGYTTVKQAYTAARTLISKIFGPKIHKDFPKKLLESDNCGNGFYPSTARGRYGHRGVDLEVSANAEIVVPFTGDVSVMAANEISIVADELDGIEIILSSISLNSGKDGMKVFKGEPLGRATSSGCTPNSIHLAMRKVGTTEYIDPTRYLEKRIMPKPKWIQECDDYLVKLLFKVYAEGSLTKGPKDNDTTPARGQEPDVSGLQPIPTGNRKKRDIPFITALQQRADDFTDRLGLPRISEIGPVLAGFNIKDIKVGQILDLLETFGLTELKKKLENALNTLEDLLGTGKCVATETMDDDTLKLGLKARGKSTSGSRMSLIKRFKDPDEGCKGLHKQLPGGIACRFSDNCLSVTCCVELKLVVIRRVLEASLTLDPCSLELTLTVGNFKRTFSVTDHLAEQYSGSIVDNLNVMDVVTFTVTYSIKRVGNKVTVDLSASMCAKDKCKQFSKVFDGLTLSLPQCSGARSLTARRAKLIDLDQLKEKTLQEIKELLDIKNPGSFDIQQLMKNLREAYLEIAKDALNNLLGKLFPGQFSSFDVCMDGVKIFGPNDITFFSFTFNFFLGPVPMQFVFSAGGSWKVECGVKLCFLTMKAEGTATPQIGAMVSGELNVNFLLFKAGLKLTGYLLTTKLPTKAEVGFSKFPLDVGIRMDLELIPLRLELRAILKLTVNLLVKKIEKTLINKLLWQYTTPSITANIFDLHNKEPDNSPPTFNSFATTSGSGSGKRSSPSGQCTVYQVKNRDYTEPAFQLAIAVEDDRSEVEVSYSVGSFQGGSDLAKDEVLGGPSAVVEQVLPSRIPLYFTVKGTNSAGGTASVTCQLSSYDTTPPAGRVIPDFFTTSHPNVLKASAMAVDETPLVERKEAIGFGRGIYGDQAFPWSDISSRALRSSTKSVETSLLQFTSPRLGKLMSKPHQVKLGHATPGKCASACLALPPLKCISFNYDYGTSGRCELLEEVEGHGVQIHIAGHFHYFERLGIGHAVTFNHRDLQLQHNQLYYFNYFLKNQLGYTNILTSQPVKVDFTPVSPGPIQNAHYDETVKEPCHELLPDKWENRCVDESNLPNHRYIIDGEGSSTVFNGHTPFVDVLYTRANKYVSANWDGFHDNETGIYGYTWSVGTEKCLENIHPHKDPHAHLFDESEWTHTGLAHPLDLEDGLYYVSVRAINKVEYGGPLATTVCHSTPYVIDNTEPLIHEVFEMLYDEETHVISASYNVSDPLSNIKEMHIGLGKSTRDTYILDWFVHDDADSVEFTHHIPDGQPTWLRIRAVNNVDLRTAGHGPYPILVDTTHPLAGDLYDGKSHGRQVNFQSSQSEICANWENFQDPDTGIADYLWGVGTSPGEDDVVEFKRLNHFVFLHCDNSVNLTHNATYYSTLYAFNRGHKRLNVSANSEGVLVDLTPPEAGWLKDGDTIGQDLKYSSSPATVSGNWGGFTDPESGIQQYTIAVLRKPKHQVEDDVIHESESVGMTTSFRWHHFHLHQGDQVFVNLNVTNRALGVTTLQSDGFVLDLTPPVLKYLRDGLDPDKDAQYSSSTMELTANWKFVDEETGVDYIELQVYQKHGGTRSPLGESVTLDGEAKNWTSTEALSLNIGALYTVKVRAINAAGLTAVHETDGVLIDPTPPEILFIHAGVLSGMDDEVLTNGFVVITNTGVLTASWLGLDGESGIDSYWISLGTTHGGDDVKEFYSVGEVTDIILTELPLQLYENGSPIYYISVKAQNGAGAFSTTVTASPIKVVAADVSGLVFDGAGSSDLTAPTTDVNYQLEATTVSLQFEGYESVQHGIIGYEWAVGTNPGADDIQPFTDVGIVAFDEPAGSGTAQILLPLSPSNRYFSSVRAITGAFNILESTSDGFGVDQSAPSVSIVSVGEDEDDSGNMKPLGRETVYQAINVGSLAAEWNVGDNESAIAAAWFAIGFTPVSSDLYNVTNTEKRTSLAAGLLTPSADGTPNMVTVTVMNNVGLVSSDVSSPVVFDETPPERVTVACPKHISGDVPFKCSWEGINDQESGVQHYIFSLGVSAGDDSVVNSTTIYPPTNHLSIMGLNQSFLQQGATFYATVIAVNRADLHSISYSRAIYVDTTPPVPGVVVEVNDNVTVSGNLRAAVCNTEEECHVIDAECQMSVDHIHVAWEPFRDSETDIARYEVAIGTASGRRDLQDFTKVPSGMTSYVFTQLDLLSVGQVFATVRGYNGAGQFALALSNGIFISRLSAGLQPLGKQFVHDGDKRDTDMDFQASSEQLSASWSFGDPCPMAKYDWSIHRMDGVEIQPFTTLPGDQTFGDNSNIKAKEGESFFVIVRGTNQLGDSFILRSDGISIRKEPLIPGEVRDGPVLGLDQNFQLSITTLSANWDQFGIDREVAGVLDGNERSDLEINKHQTIDHYEVAVGTDRRYASTRSNIVPFTNVGRNRTVTMLDLPLTPRANYYITVRGYSVSTSTTDVTSNGIQVGVGSEVVSRGKVNVERFISSTSTLTFSWEGFEFSLPVRYYHWGLGTAKFNTDNIECSKMHEFDESGALTSAYASLFDVHPFINVERDTLVDLANMTLEHKGTYYVTVMASDESLQCDVFSAPFTVDITPPERGRVQIGPFANLPVQYTDRGDEVTILWEDFLDEESGILQYHITLLGPVQCGNTADNAAQLTEPVTLHANYSSYTFVDLFLEETMVYFVLLNAVNRATGSTTVTSSPVLIDPRDPIPGDIVDGDSFKRDVSHQSSTSSLHGTFTLFHGQEPYRCSYNHHDLDAPTEAWSPVTSQGVWGTSIEASRIKFAPEQLSYSVSNGLTVTMVRDVRAERMISGGYMTVLNHEGPGIFQIDMVAAGTELDSVTSLVFWDGPAGVVGGFEMPSKTGGNSNFSTSAPTTTPATTQNPWQIVNDNSEETSDENAVLRTLPYTGIGMDIFHEVTAEGHPKYYILLWSRFRDEPSALQYEKIELGFDASEAWHTYGLKYVVDRTDATQELWGFELHIDGQYFTTITGIPPVSISTKLILAVRNKQGAVAEFHDVFNPPTVMAHFKNLRTPPSAEMLCRYGTPFQDGSTTILKIFAGVGTTRGADDVEPFFEVEDLCTPCMDECSRYSCDMNCTVDDITLHHASINNLHLSTHKMITQDNVTTSTPALYYITIKAVSGSGRFAVSSSDGVYVDATPPVFESLYHVDLSWSEDEPSDFQGSNSTIAVSWEAYDIESQVVEYLWAIGTAPFSTDIQDYVSVGLATSASNSQLEGSLQPLQTYYATVIAVNAAGLNTTKSTTGVTFLEKSPSSENMTIGVGCQNDGSSSEDDVSVCPGIKSSVEISWPDFDEREGITGYYFSIGSTGELEDIIPETQVGYNESGTVLIEDGQVLINGQVIANISDLRHMQNDDQSTPEVNKFNMEPGRKMYVKVKACNSAHKCSIIDLKVIVVSREGDVVATATNSSKVSVTLNSSGATRSARTYVNNGVNIVTTGITPGDGLVAGMLDKHAVEEEYVSGASSTFTPFIVDPERTRNNSERSLNGRLREFDETFFISLLHDNPLTGPLKITIPINADLIPEGTLPVLLYWSTELQQWMDASRTCSNLDKNVQYDWEQNLLHVNVCSTHPATKTSGENVRRRRSSDVEFFSGSTQFAEASVDRDIINTAPVVTSPSAMWMYEDSGTLRAQLQAQDAEGDELIFSLDSEPEDIMGEAVLSPEGLLEYTPCRHCFGLVKIGYVVQEKPTGETTPLEVRETLTIDVRPQNDNPGLLVLIDGVNVVSDQGTNTYRPVELPVKQGEENSIVLWLYDVDVADDLAFSVSQPQHGGIQIGPVCKNVTFLSTPCSMSNTNDFDITSGGTCTVCKPSNLNTTKEIHDLSWALARLTYISRNESYFGEDSFAIHGIDENSGASKILPIDVFVLQKCKNNGTCIGPAEDPDCEDTQLAFGFEGYTCDCTDDYIGQFCQLEIVPCLPPMAPANGAVSPDDATSYQDVVEFSCDPGYELVGDSAHVCQWDGSWNGSTPNCDPVPCPTLSAPVNGALSPGGPHVYQDVVTFTCSTGYVVASVSTVTCQADGTWSGTAPTCNRCHNQFNFPRNNFDIYENRCHWFSQKRDMRTYAQAKRFCEDRGGRLVTIKTSNKQDFLAGSKDLKVKRARRSNFWIGLDDLWRENIMKWSDGTTLKNGNYNNWKFPPRRHKKRDCAAIHRSNLKWVLVNCRMKFPFICEMDDTMI
ncbi:uncharacterized protein LOC144905141 [Branchiostoma floridae x Branchiostoma belcheri]